jgi:transcriptional regulator with GAF, ATPase, and Fis domain
MEAHMFSAATAVATSPASEQAYFEISPELLSALAEALDIHSVLPRVSKVANTLVPHDALLLAFVDATGETLVHSTAGDLSSLALDATGAAARNAVIVGDLRTEAMAAFDEHSKRRVLAAGYRALMTVTPGAGKHVLRLQFWSKRPYAFDRDDLPVAHRIAEHLAVGVAHESLARATAGSLSPKPLADRDDKTQDRRPVRPDGITFADTRVIGESAPWRLARTMAAQVAPTDSTVLVTGESGTGKEVLARFIHRSSARQRGPFVALNCAALPEHLLESELFGFERGAFTGAQQPKPGLIELAAGGTLFLDEVTEMSASAQAKFLRVLQEREFLRLGGTRPIKANIRVIAATNRDLRDAVQQGDFRQDLYYRLQVFPIVIPPLRERRDDILPLSEALLREIGRSLRQPPAGLTREARRTLQEHSWPGNVRELRNALERAAILAQGELIGTAHLALDRGNSTPCAVPEDLSTMERATITRVMRECRGNKSSAARRLGLSRTQLYFRLRKYGLEEQQPA